MPLSMGWLRDGQEVVLGLRLGDLERVQEGSGALGTIAGTVERVEFHGDQVLASLVWGGASLQALLPACHRPAEGDRVAFRPKAGALHAFDAETKTRIAI